MKFTITTKESLINVLRQAGYRVDHHDISTKQDSFIRRLRSAPYPRFHIYGEKRDNMLILNIHLDQKKPSYEGSHAHSGEYDGELVEGEVKRIRSLDLSIRH